MEHSQSLSPVIKLQGDTRQLRNFVFSPINEENMGSCSTTPRRKLCLDLLDDSLQSPTDSAFGDCLSMDMRSPECSLSVTSLRGPEELSHLYARRQRLSLVLPGKENCPHLLSDVPPPKHRALLSLPASPLANDIRFSSLMKQISSPLERMKIGSPAPVSSTSDNSNGSDGYFSEIFDQMIEENSNGSIPESISSLLTTPFTECRLTDKEVKNNDTPVRSGRIRSTSLKTSLKRPTPTESLPYEKPAKRSPLPSVNSMSSPPRRKPPKGTTLFRSHSLCIPHSENANMFPISPGEGGVERIGDHSKPYVLPLVSLSSCVPDQKNVSPETVARLLKNDFVDLVHKFTIVDCRYPYEYQGGHIEGAVNIWEKEEALKRFFTTPTHPKEDEGRTIIIFHCEFSSKRGPEMSRFMRKIDRERNGMDFPKLFYPELYLLHGGYKNFYNSYPDLCKPQLYRCMLDENHKEDLKHFSKRSKSWTGGENSTVYRRTIQHSLRHRHSVHDARGMYSSVGKW